MKTRSSQSAAVEDRFKPSLWQRLWLWIKISIIVLIALYVISGIPIRPVFAVKLAIRKTMTSIAERREGKPDYARRYRDALNEKNYYIRLNRGNRTMIHAHIQPRSATAAVSAGVL